MSCPDGQYFCNDRQKCMPIPKGSKVRKDGELVSEVAPPSKKHERMVKHIKKSYKKDGKLTKDEKSIAYATAWKDYKKKVVNEQQINTNTLFRKEMVLVPESVRDQFKPSLKDELLSRADKKYKKAKSFKQFKRDAASASLKRGEVRKLVNGKWVSNKKEEVEIQEKSAAWQRKEGKNKTGGLNEKGRKSYERENPGSDLKAPQPEGGPRKRSFCARMGGVKGPMKKPDGSPTRKALALRKWKC